jgi:hypothetical protein
MSGKAKILAGKAKSLASSGGVGFAERAARAYCAELV